MSSWLTAQEIADAKLAGLPATKRGIARIIASEGWEARRDRNGRPLWRERAGRGGGKEWHVSLLPVQSQAGLVKVVDATARQASPPTDAGQGQEIALSTAPALRDESEAIATYEHLPARVRKEATWRLNVILQVEALTPVVNKNNAVAQAAREAGIGPSTVWNWLDLIKGVSREARLPALAPRPKGKPAKLVIDSDLLAFFTDDWLRAAQPSFESCYRRTMVFAGKRQLMLPPAKTLIRRVRESVPKYREVLMREGLEALGRMFPHQERDRSHFRAMDCVCADGHKWDVFVRFPDNIVARPISVGFQDLHSNKILSIRHGRSETAFLVNMAIHDMVRDWGIPDQAWLDNGRAFASKWVTGGQANRFRFKVKDTDPVGSLTGIGTTVRWTKPYSGQSKPIERAWRDFCDNISKHPAFAGAYTGNNPLAKPHDYASAAVPYQVFAKIVADGIAEHNARTGRRTRVCGGVLSFNQAFDRSYSDRLIARADPWHLRTFLLEADHITVSGPDCSIKLGGNRYWHEALSEWKGRRMVVRFDPINLHADLLVYTPDGSLLCEAPCLEAVGFDSAGDAKDWARAKAAFTRGEKALAQIAQQYTPRDIANHLCDVSEFDDALMAVPERPRPRVIGSNAAVASDPNIDAMLDYFAAQTDPDNQNAGRFDSGLRLVE